MGSGSRRRALKGWFAACGTATAAIYLLLVLVLFGSGRIISIGEGVMSFLIVIPVVLIITCVVTAIPAALVIWVSEISRMRSALFFGFAGGAIGIFGQAILFQSSFFPAAGLFASVGFVAGLTYWRIAGKPAETEPS